MGTKLTILALPFLVLSSCAPYGHWGRYMHWDDNCPDFPSLEEVETVLTEESAVIDKLKEKDLLSWLRIEDCPDGAFITMYLHGNRRQAVPFLAILDEKGARAEGLNRFFGIPFRIWTEN